METPFHEAPKPAPLSITGLLEAAWRRKGLILLITLALTVADLAVVLALPKSYRAEVLLQVDQRASRTIDGNVPSLAAELDGGGLAGQADMIRSPALALRVINTGKLMETPEYVDALGPPGQPRHGLLSRIRDVAREWAEPVVPEDILARILPPALREGDVALRRQEENAIEFFLRRLQVTYDMRGSSLRIRYTSEDPVLAASVANAVADAYVEQQMRPKLELLRSASTWLEERLEGLRIRAVAAENRLTEFRLQHQLGTTQAPAYTQQQLADLHTQLVVTIGAQATAEARLRTAETAARDRRLEDLPEAIASNTMRALREQESTVARRIAELTSGGNMRSANDARAELGEVRRRIVEEHERVLNSLRLEVAVTRARRTAIQQTIASYTSAAEEREKFSVQAAVLEREAVANRTVFDAAVRRTEETRMLDGLQRPDVGVVSEARVPTRPYNPNVPLIGALGFVTSFLIGTGTALLAESRKVTIRSLAQGEAALGVVGLGWLPAVRLRRRGQVHDLPLEAPSDMYSECLRSSAVSMKTYYRRERQVLLVTSAMPQEGKTSFALSYARTLAAAGQRVLLIDADLRRPVVATRLQSPPARGLAEALTGAANFEQVVQHDEPSGLAFITAGQQAVDPLWALDSKAFAELVEQARARYTLVVIDAPPLLAASEGVMLAQHVDMALLVVAWARTPVRMAVRAISRLRLAGVGSVAFLLSLVDVSQLNRADQELLTLDYAYGQPNSRRRLPLRLNTHG